MAKELNYPSLSRAQLSEFKLAQLVDSTKQSTNAPTSHYPSHNKNKNIKKVPMLPYVKNQDRRDIYFKKKKKEHNCPKNSFRKKVKLNSKVNI